MSFRLNQLLFFLSVLLVSNGFAIAHDIEKDQWLAQPVVKNWVEENGLQSENILGICQGQNGYLWLGTYEGLIRFDGYEFTVYTTQTTPAAPHNSVEYVFPASDGSVWFGGSGPGVSQLKNGEIHTFGKDLELKEEFVTGITEDLYGNIWVLTRDKLFNLIDGKLVNHSIPGSDTKTNICISVMDENSVLVGTTDGLYLYEDKEWSLVGDSLIRGASIDSLQRVGSTVWIHTHEGDIFNYTDDGVTLFFQSSDSSLISSMAVDSKDNVWFIHSDGLIKHSHGKTTLYENSPESILFSRSPLCVDREGNIWTIGGNRSLIQIRIPRFEYYSTYDGLPQCPVTGITQRNGLVIVSTWDHLYVKKQNRFEQLETTPPLLEASVRGLVSDSENNLWVATDIYGLLKVSPDNHVTPFKDEIGSSKNFVRCVYEDTAGVLWVGTDMGLFTVYKEQFELVNHIGLSKILGVSGTEDGSVWISVAGKGIYRYIEENWTQYTTDEGIASIVTFHCNQIGEDDFLIATNMGLSRVHKGKISKIDSKNGLPSDSIFYSINDSNGYVWFATNPGVYRIQKEELKKVFDGALDRVSYDIYDRTDGISNSEMTAPANPYVNELTGRIWFPTRGGSLVVDPLNLPRKLDALKTIIEEIRIDGEKTHVKPDGFVVVPKGTKRLEFLFTAPSFYFPEGTAFRVKLDGYDEEWIDCDASRSYAYTNLKPGNYQFNVASRNCDDVWDTRGASVRVVLQPLFVQTLFFKITVITFGLFLFASLFLLRIYRLQLRKNNLEKIVDKRTEELKLALKTANDASQSKNNFLAMMSHEVRTPMNGVIGMLDLLLGSDLREEEQEYAEIAKESASSLMRILNDILDLSRIESQKMVFESIEFSLRDAVGEAVKLMRPKAEGKGLDLVVSISESIPVLLVGDPMRLRQIILNLLSNAVKFTDEGKVELMVDVVSEKELTYEFEFKVRDTGVGIKPIHMKHLFNLFEQGDVSTARKYGGSGLGLAICKKLLTYMGGDIHCHSIPEQGSIFTFTSVFEKANRETACSVEVASPKVAEIDDHARILLVEDMKVNQTIVKHLIKKTEHTLDIAENGKQALEMLQSNHFDLVLMDISMPVMDGVEATHKIKAGHLGINPNTIVIALTANAMDGDRERFLAEGMDDYLSKPIKNDLFYRTIKSHLMARSQSSST